MKMKKLFRNVVLSALALCLALNLAACGSESVPPVVTETPVDSVELTPPVPEETPAAEEAPQSTMATELYACDLFTVNIPAGWKLVYEAYDVNSGKVLYNESGKQAGSADKSKAELWILAQDPQDENNIMFYASWFGPYFTSLGQKNAMLPSLTSENEWAPVLDRLDAEDVLNNWGPMYTLLAAQNRPIAAYLRCYRVDAVAQANVADGASNQLTASEVFASVSIPGASQPYGMYFYDELQRVDFSSTADYYASLNNYAFVIGNDRASDADAMMDCVKSFDFTGFDTLYGA